MKRAVDLLVAIPLLVLAGPLILLAAAFVRLSSGGPAFFSQIRVGRNAALFRCYKLRTMHAGTASLPTHQVAVGAVTPVGRILRRLKVDELPQLWNVLTGDMSLVGPRPCLPTQKDLIEHRQKLGVYVLRPGIERFGTNPRDQYVGPVVLREGRREVSELPIALPGPVDSMADCFRSPVTASELTFAKCASGRPPDSPQPRCQVAKSPLRGKCL